MKTYIFAALFSLISWVFFLILMFSGYSALAQETWRGLTVEPEDRCTPYDRDSYPYRQSIEDDLFVEYGAVYSPYTGVYFDSDRETDIEHMVAVSEAHDSGMCRMTAGIKQTFSNDLLNLTFADPHTNRRLKRDFDAAEWLPEMNQCWFANRVMLVKQKYRLAVDEAERDALEAVLGRCESTEMSWVRGGGNPSQDATGEACEIVRPERDLGIGEDIEIAIHVDGSCARIRL